jgi:hypothetical protein
MKDIGKWFQLCSSLDVIGDTTLAIDAYLDGVVGASVEGHAHGAEYLVVYGLLQVLVVQQDAIEHLHGALGISFDIKQFPKLVAIRDIRNASVGHPTRRDRPKTKPVSYHFISRVTLNRGGFQLLSANEHGMSEFSTVKTAKLIADQREEVANLLETVVDELQRREAEHKAAFQVEKLVDAFSSNIGYAFEKLGEAVRSSGPRQLGEWAIDEVQRSLDGLRDALERRDIALDTYDSIYYVYGELEYPIDQLRRFLRHQDTDIATREMAGIVAFFIKARINRLQDLARELDDDYSS